MKYRNRYRFKLENGRNEPIKDLEHTLRIVIVDEERVGAQDITFAYCRFEPVQYYNLLLCMDFQGVILKSNPTAPQKMGILCF